MDLSKFLPLLPLLPVLLSPLFPLLQKKKAATVMGLFAALSLGIGALCLLPFAFPSLFAAGEGALRFGTVEGLRFRVGGIHSLYAAVCGFMFGLSALFSPRYFAHGEKQHRYCFFNFLTYGATIGVFLSADLLTCFTCFEILSFCSAAWVVHEEERESIAAAKTYLAVSVFGGLLLFFGLAVLYSITGTVVISELSTALAGNPANGRLWVAGICMLLGFGAKAGMFPLQIWLPKAHPVAPAPASALLSGILTKVGVYGVLAVAAECFAGSRAMAWLLLTLALVTMFLGALLALFSVNLKRTLACSSMSQIGFILSGIGSCLLLQGEAAEAAAAGTLLHMLNHSLIKLVLFLAAGAVFENLRTLSLNDLRGWGRKKPFLAVCFLLGALDIAGIPGFGGYLSKTLLHEALAEAGGELGGIALSFEWIFLLSGGLTLAYMTKLFICVFLQKHPEKQAEYDAQKRYLSPAQYIALALATAALLPVGLPKIAYRILGERYEGDLFSGECLLGIGISAGIGIAVYLFVVRPLLMKKGGYLDRWPKALDLEKAVYLPCIRALSRAGRAVAFCFDYPCQHLDKIALFLCRVGKWIASIPDTFGERLDQIAGVCSAVGCAVARIPDRLSDGAVLLLRKTLLRELPVKTAALTPAAERRAAKLASAKAERDRTLEGFHFAVAAACLGIVAVIGWILIRFVL